MDKIELSQIRLKTPLSAWATRKRCWKEAVLKALPTALITRFFTRLRAVLALDGSDMRHHSGVIAEFRRLYIKTGVFPTELSAVISGLFNVRSESDYDDMYCASEEVVALHVKNARLFLDAVKDYLVQQY